MFGQQGKGESRINVDCEIMYLKVVTMQFWEHGRYTVHLRRYRGFPNVSSNSNNITFLDNSTQISYRHDKVFLF